MTIDLGFAWLNLEVNGQLEEVGVVDVPGHHDFIENMLAGVGGIDLALLVVAADEGVMPQTSEHLAILDLLDVASGLVVLTKTDLIDDADWLELVTLDLQEKVAGTVLEDAPIIPVSAITGAGLPELRSELAARLAQTTSKPDLGRPRLPIDRIFSLPGFGTIVTGTLSGGRLFVGDAIEIHPGPIPGRIRGLQTHKTKRESVLPGSRVAVNLSGVDTGDLERGMVISYPGQLRDTVLLDATYRHLPSAAKPLRHNVEVKLFTGAIEVMARTRVLGARAIEPGAEGWLQLALYEPVAVERGEHFILRRPSPSSTLGGGLILDPHPGRRHRRFQAHVVERLQTLTEGTPQELLLQRLERGQPAEAREVLAQAGLSQEEAQAAWDDLVAEGQVIILDKYAVTAPYWGSLRQRALAQLEQYHRQYPLRRGIPREELRNRLTLSGAVFNALVRALVEAEQVQDNGAVVFLADHQIRLDAEQQKKVGALLDQFREAGVNAPSVKESRAELGDALYEALLELDQLAQVNEEVVYRRADLDAILEKIMTFLKTHESVNAAEVRDLLGTSRKYAIALLEYLDQQRMTRRVGDHRVPF